MLQPTNTDLLHSIIGFPVYCPDARLTLAIAASLSSSTWKAALMRIACSSTFSVSDSKVSSSIGYSSSLSRLARKKQY